jgi:alpha-tubulin suppressor-like RCC1 family protein
MTTGSVRCWGENTYGQLGDGTNESRQMQAATDVLADIQAVSVGGAFTCALTVTGGVRCWGNNYAGQLGDGTYNSRSTPPTADVLTSVKAIATGSAHACALMENGGVRCWGDNMGSQLGDGTTTESLTPSSDVLTDVQAVAASYESTCAVMTSGGLRCWGGNTFAPGGYGGIPSMDLLTDVRNIAMAAKHVCALMTSGGIRCWGANVFGQLGDGTLTGRLTPPYTDVLADVQAIAVGGDIDLSTGHTCALLGTGGISCWGADQYGQLGDMPYGYQQGTPEYCHPEGDANVVECRKNPTAVLAICQGQ